MVLLWEGEVCRHCLLMFWLDKWEVSWLLNLLRVPQAVGSIYKRLKPEQDGGGPLWLTAV